VKNMRRRRSHERALCRRLRARAVPCPHHLRGARTA
jgi:hypothetical protein